MTNCARLHEDLAKSKINALLLTNMASIRWATNFTGSFAAVIITPVDGCFITDSRYRIQAGDECLSLPIRSFANPHRFEDLLKEVIQQSNIHRLHFDQNHVTVATISKWRQLLPDVEFVPIDDPVDTLRMQKTESELARIRAACCATEECLEKLLTLVKPGVTEQQLVWAFEDMLRPLDATFAFSPIIVGGPRTARPHATPGKRAFEIGDFITFDIGIRLNGYCSDITRTVVLGKASVKQREYYQQLLKAQMACINTIKPGMNGKEIDGLAREILNEKDLGQFFGHGLGHGLGALVHDTGRLSSLVSQNIEVGQVWTIEPGFYIDGFGGARIEDDIVITSEGCESLTSFPKHLIELPY